MAEDFGSNRRSFAGDNPGGNRGRGRDGKLNDLVRSKDVGTGYTGTCSADIEGFGELDEFGARSVSSP